MISGGGAKGLRREYTKLDYRLKKYIDLKGDCVEKSVAYLERLERFWGFKYPHPKCIFINKIF